MTKRDWYNMSAKGKTAEIMIHGQIGQSFWDDNAVGAKEFITDLKALGDITRLTVNINSPGGSVFEGNSIYNALQAHKAHITVNIDGVAASIASVIAMAGDTVVMPENAMMMIHNPMGSVFGNSEDMAKQIVLLDKVKEGLVSSYVQKTGSISDVISELMNEETWFTATEALAQGFADEVSKPVTAVNNYDLSG